MLDGSLRYKIVNMRHLLLLFIILLAAGAAFGQNVIWEKANVNASAFLALEKLTDGGLVVSGCLNEQPQYPGRIAKYSEAGALLWNKNMRLLRTGEMDIKQAASGKLIFAASLYRSPISNYFQGDNFLQQIDEVT